MENYENFKNEYYNKLKVDLKNDLTPLNIDIIKKLGIELEDKIYTEREFEELNMMILSFYNEQNDEPKNELLIQKKVSKKEYLDLLDSINKINEKYNF